MINAGSTPAVRVDSYTKYHENYKECASVEFDGDFPAERELVVMNIDKNN